MKQGLYSGLNFREKIGKRKLSFNKKNFEEEGLKKPTCIAKIQTLF